MYWWTNSSWNTLEHALKSLKKIFARKFTPKNILEKQFKFLMPFKITIWQSFYPEIWEMNFSIFMSQTLSEFHGTFKWNFEHTIFNDLGILPNFPDLVAFSIVCMYDLDCKILVAH